MRGSPSLTLNMVHSPYLITNGNVLAVNGEIYNHMLLRSELKKEHLWQTKSDCEVILYLYDEYGPNFLTC